MRKTLLLGAAMGALLAGGAAAQLPEFLSFQGRMTDNGQPVTGSKTIDFKLFDQPTGGAQVWAELSKFVMFDDNGLFTVDLGDSTSFDGVDLDQNLWLELKDTSQGSPFDTRIPLRAAPYALLASEAEGLALKDTYYLSSDAGGDALQQLIDSIPAGGPGMKRTIVLGAGTFFMNQPLQMRSFINIVGVDRGATQISSGGSTDSTSYTVVMTGDADLENLTVSCFTMSEPYCKAVLVEDTFPNIRNVNIQAQGGSSETVGLHVRGTGAADGADPTVDNVEVFVQAPAAGAGVLVDGSDAEGFLINSIMDVIDTGAGNVYAARVINGANLFARNVEFFVEADTGSSGISGALNFAGSSGGALQACQIDVEAVDGTGEAIGLEITGSNTDDIILLNSLVLVTSEAGTISITEGVLVDGSATVRLEGTSVQVTGSSPERNGVTVANAGGDLTMVGGRLTVPSGGGTSRGAFAELGNIRLGVMQMAGSGPVKTSGTFSCFQVANGTMTGATTCP